MRATAMPRGQLVEGRAAGRSEVGAKPVLRCEGYHRRGRAGRGERVMVDTPQGRVCAGVILTDAEGRVVLRKDVDERKHQVRFPQAAWAIANEALEAVELTGVERVEIRDSRTGHLWWCLPTDFERWGEALDRGCGPQTALALKFFSFVPGDSVTARQLAVLEAGT